MPSGPVLILTALEFEARPIVRRLGLRRRSRTAYAAADNAVRLNVIGPLARHLADVPADAAARAVVMAGVAGGLAAELRRGDLVLDDTSIAIDLPIRRGRVVTLDTLATTPAMKRQLHDTTGGLVADMENATVRDWARGRGLPFVGLRAVSDTADEPLDPVVLRVVDDRGFLRPMRVTGEIVRRPSTLAAFWRLRTAERVVRDLAGAVERVVRALD